MNQKGYSMIEITLSIVLLAIAIPSLLLWFSELNRGSVAPQALPTANFLAAQMMEEIKSRKFDERSAKDANGNWSTTMGVDSGESAANKATFDDVDDFNGWVQTFGANYPGYSASVTVGYVASNNLNTLLTIPQPVSNNWTPSYKRISVTLTHPNLAAAIQIVTIVTEVQSL